MSADDKNKEEEKDNNDNPPIEEITAVTQQHVTANGIKLEYTVTTGTMVLKEEDEKKGEKEKATIFYIAYSLNGVKDSSKRPLTFSFNGGPGSSSVWLHMGLLGPKRVLMDEDGMPLPPPFRLVDNDFTLLDKTDLVFIDPVSTGYSRTVPGEKAEDYHDVKKDIESIGDFIRLYTTRSQRWNSPKFLIGESYGTTRAAGLAGYLHTRHGMYLNGVILVSVILNFLTGRFDPGNDMPYILFLPTYCATAWYHKKLEKDLQADLQKTLREVEEFAAGDYTLALMKGSAIPDEERTKIVQKLARYTGLSEDYIDRTNLRINIHRFCKELRRDEGIVVGRLDSRFTSRELDQVDDVSESDPSYNAILGPYTSTFNDYVRKDLEFELDKTCEILTGLYLKWNTGDFKGQYINTGEALRQAMQYHPGLKVLAANGYFDLATPYFATEYTMNHLNLPAEQIENITFTYYEAGHMMYLHLPSLKMLKKDLDEFIDNAIN